MVNGGLNELTNRPGTFWEGATGSGMDWRLAVSELEAERRNLRLDGEPVILYSLLSPPGSARANLLEGLSRLDATLTVALEWRPQRLDAARRKIRGAQRHYFSTRYSMAAHVQETEGTASAMVDTAAAAESDRLGDTLVELETDGIAYGDLALTVAIHGPLAETEGLDGDIRRLFASHDAKVIREGYGQLPAWFSRMPAQPRRRQVRSVFVSAGLAAAMAPIFGPPVGTPKSRHLQKAALAILETQWRTPYHYDLFQGDVGHTLVLGATGSGKSFSLNFLLVQALKYDPRVLILDLPGALKALIPSPSRQHHFTRFDQVNQLVGASEADPDLGFMARLLALCYLPRTNPGTRTQYKRVNGPYTLYMNTTADNKLPYGNLPRLILAWVCSEAVRTQSRELVLGKSLSEFMRTLGVYSSSGEKHTRLRNQMKRLFGCTVSMIYENERGEARVSSLVADRTVFWWNESKPDEPMLWESKIYLGEAFFYEIIRHPVPIKMNALNALKRSALDSISTCWLVYPSRSATPHLAAPVQPVWGAPSQVKRQQHRSSFPLQGAARVEEDQAGLAGVELLDGQGRLDPLALNPGHRSVRSKPASKLICPFPPQGSPLTAL